MLSDEASLVCLAHAGKMAVRRLYHQMHALPLPQPNRRE